jgi:hypothetical protein
LLSAANVFAQEALKSFEEEYYDFLALQGLTERPALSYRTLSDSVWNIDKEAEHSWQDNNLGVFHSLFGDFRMRIYGPELFMSGNTATPYGQNDGVLWQGRGFNALFKSGIRFEGYGIELTLLPHFAFSQNAEFEIMPSMYNNEYGYFWSYQHNAGIDAPQRFGNEPFFDWDFGDSEIRYTWKTLTAGFGTQTIWLGHAYLNPILHSNNAPAYPKVDIGLRRQRVVIPGLNWYAGDIEARLWVGQLSESDYFDDDVTNDYTMFHGFSFAYAPSFLPGLTLFVNRVCLVPWAWENLSYMFKTAQEFEDQKASFGFSWLFPQVGFEVYGELAIDDWVPGNLGGIRRPFHTTVYGFGFKKTLPIMPLRKIYGELLFEYDWLEKTMEYAVRPYSFYAHHQIVHGYTNKGQWLGNGVSPIGNAQSLKFTLYYPDGNSSLMISRNNPNTHYIYENEFWASNERKDMFHNAFWANFNIDLSTRYFFTSNFTVMAGVTYNLIINPNYKRIFNDEPSSDTYIHNFSFQLGVKIYI